MEITSYKGELFTRVGTEEKKGGGSKQLCAGRVSKHKHL